MSLFDSGIRPAVDDFLKKKSEEEREYGDYWSASSAGYCPRLNIMRRLKIPPVPELADSGARIRTFEAGHIFHEWIQRVTKDAGLSIAQEVELQDEDLMVRGHFDDLVLVDGKLILYDYKTAHSASFNYSKGRPISYYHKMQLGTYLYMLRTLQQEEVKPEWLDSHDLLAEARILSISKDDLRMDEKQLLWSEGLSSEVRDYWTALNAAWDEYQRSGELPACTCLDHEGGFMGRRSSKGKVYNDYFYEDEPCSLKWFKLKQEELYA